MINNFCKKRQKLNFSEPPPSYLQNGDNKSTHAWTLLTKVHIVKAMVFPVVMDGCQRWTINKAEHQRTELWCWRKLLRVPCTARWSNRSILKEINPEFHWKDWCWILQYFGHLTQRANSHGSSVHAVFQARILEWNEISYSRGSSWPGDWTCISHISCTGKQIFTTISLGKPVKVNKII